MAVWKKSELCDASSPACVKIRVQSLICIDASALEESSALLLHVCRRLSVPSEVIFVVKAGLYHRGKSFRDQPYAIFV